LLPSTEDVRNGTRFKANPCTFDVFEILAEQMKIATMNDWCAVSDFEDEQEKVGCDIWQHVMYRLKEEKAMPVGTLRGTVKRIVVAKPIGNMTDECTGETIPRLLFFALPICKSPRGTRRTILNHTYATRRLTCVQIPASGCFLEDLEDKSDAEGYAAHLLINDLHEIYFTYGHSVGQPVELAKTYDYLARKWQQMFGREGESGGETRGSFSQECEGGRERNRGT
jgi:hypothetical protein